jgi:hypothetical protein
MPCLNEDEHLYTCVCVCVCVCVCECVCVCVCVCVCCGNAFSMVLRLKPGMQMGQCDPIVCVIMGDEAMEV